MHNLKEMQFLHNYTSPLYNGPAAKLGAGVQVLELAEAAKKAGYMVVGGDCPTVGTVGGYTQGGGHSPLMSLRGLSADQALEWHAIDGNGTFRIATPYNNTDLYWALSGGGGGTYAVVLSAVLKLYPDVPVAGGL